MNVIVKVRSLYFFIIMCFLLATTIHVWTLLSKRNSLFFVCVSCLPRPCMNILVKEIQSVIFITCFYLPTTMYGRYCPISSIYIAFYYMRFHQTTIIVWTLLWKISRLFFYYVFLASHGLVWTLLSEWRSL